MGDVYVRRDRIQAISSELSQNPVYEVVEVARPVSPLSSDASLAQWLHFKKMSAEALYHLTHDGPLSAELTSALESSDLGRIVLDCAIQRAVYADVSFSDPNNGLSHRYTALKGLLPNEVVTLDQASLQDPQTAHVNQSVDPLAVAV